MAYNVKHAFEIISEDIQRDRLPSVLFLYGEEDYLVQWACDMIVQKYVEKAVMPLDLVRFRPDAFDVFKVSEACETLPVLSEKKVVILENFYFVWGGAPAGVFGEDKKKIFSEMLKNIPASCLLVVCAPKAPDFKTDKFGTALSKTLIAAGKGYRFDHLEERQLLGFMKKRLVAAGKSADKKTLEMLAAESGYFNKEIDYGLFNLDNDLKKIIALSKEEIITREEVEKGISDNLEHNTFKLLDSISSNRKEEAFRAVRDLFLSGYKEFQLLAMIINQLELMLCVCELRARGVSRPQMTKLLKVKEYPLKKAIGFASGYSEEQLRYMLLRAFEVEANIKKGILKKELAFELFIAEI